MERSNRPTNITSALEALSPWLNNPRRTVIKIEGFVAAAVGLLFLQLILGSFRRRTSNSFIHGGLWLAYTLLPLLITYTLGLMQSSPIKIGLYPVWGLSLFMLAGGANSITAYDIDDNKKWLRRFFVLLQCYLYMFLLLSLFIPTRGWFGKPEVHFQPYRQPNYILFVGLTTTAVGITLFANRTGLIASFMVNYSGDSKRVADYMKDQAITRGDSQEFDPVSMKGCKYPVYWRGPVRTRRGGSYRFKLADEDVATVEMIWEKCNEDMFTSPGVSSRIKGACLSFALSHLLRRRFFGMDCSEASLPETRQFVLEGLLSENNSDQYTEAFRVIEVELGFLYDCFYTKYASIFQLENFFFITTALKIIFTFSIVLALLYKSPTILTRNPIIEVDTETIDIVITVVILGIFLSVEILQSILYLGTEWAMVSLACYHVTESACHGYIPFALRKACEFLFKLPLFSNWQNSIGQYSVIEGSNVSAFLLNLTAFVHRLVKLFLGKGSHFVRLPDIVKDEIVSSLKSNSEGHLTNGKVSLQRNGVLEQFSWALQNETQTDNMLIWHIATDYCSIAACEEEDVFVWHIATDSAQEGQKQLSSHQYREVATTLSRYCAYLMSKIPELLPGNFVDTKFAFDQAMYEAREALGTKRRNREGLLSAIDRSREEEEEDTIFTKGLKLGTMLESIEDSFLRWKLMAEFWAETILYIAPSDNVKAHMERLAQGGEFLTHIWALLTHAGILTRPVEPARGEDIA
ncbi:uncharacterized protein LOC133883269 [Phragmites australis]|uniref:uncharacterized protein LOC133883269 n=1 Tax=Phragmites australis TaxID=29695 RepID=UPI002D765033|nr:uncharacterized protein LOC133883269 [Phragmites australis]